MPFGVRYVVSFVRDVGASSTRLRAAEDLRTMPGPICLVAEPAPYSCPPIDLFNRELYLVPSVDALPRGMNDFLRPIDDPYDLMFDARIALPRHDKPGFFERTPISWASKTFAVEHLSGVGG